jgi:hypothetical protein
VTPSSVQHRVRVALGCPCYRERHDGCLKVFTGEWPTSGRGHKNIQHTVRYTELAPDRFKDFWR